MQGKHTVVMKNLFYAMALCLIAIVGLHAQKPASPSEFFPLRVGTYWIYKGTVRWDEPESEKPGSAEVTWKMTCRARVSQTRFSCCDRDRLSGGSRLVRRDFGTETLAVYRRRQTPRVLRKSRAGLRFVEAHGRRSCLRQISWSTTISFSSGLCNKAPNSAMPKPRNVKTDMYCWFVAEVTTKKVARCEWRDSGTISPSSSCNI